MTTWEVKITPLNVERKEASITATRTDGTDVRTFNIITAIIATQQQKLDTMDNVWAQFQADETERARIEEWIAGLEAQAKANLEGRETE